MLLLPAAAHQLALAASEHAAGAVLLCMYAQRHELLVSVALAAAAALLGCAALACHDMLLAGLGATWHQRTALLEELRMRVV